MGLLVGAIPFPQTATAAVDGAFFVGAASAAIPHSYTANAAQASLTC